MRFLWIARALVLALDIALIAGPAFADCAGGNAPDCSYVVSSNTTVKIQPALPVNLNPSCINVTNNTGQELMIPYATQAEWQSFYANPPPGVTVASCALAAGCSNLGTGKTAAFWAPTICQDTRGNQRCIGSHTEFDLGSAAYICQTQATGAFHQADNSVACYADAVYPVMYSYSSGDNCNGCRYPYWSANNYTQGTGPTSFSATQYGSGCDSCGALDTVVCGTQPTFCTPQTVTLNGINYSLPYAIPSSYSLGGKASAMIDVTQPSYTTAYNLSYGSSTYTVSDTGVNALYTCTASNWQLTGAATCGGSHYACNYNATVTNAAPPPSPPVIVKLSVFGLTLCVYSPTGQVPCTSLFPNISGSCEWIGLSNATCPSWDGTPSYTWQCINPANNATVNCSSPN
jgi:hypothetical protein